MLLQNENIRHEVSGQKKINNADPRPGSLHLLVPNNPPLQSLQFRHKITITSEKISMHGLFINMCGFKNSDSRISERLLLCLWIEGVCKIFGTLFEEFIVGEN